MQPSLKELGLSIEDHGWKDNKKKTERYPVTLIKQKFNLYSENCRKTMYWLYFFIR